MVVEEEEIESARVESTVASEAKAKLSVDRRRRPTGAGSAALVLGAVFDMVNRIYGRGGGPLRSRVGRCGSYAWLCEPSCVTGLVPVRDADA